MPCFSKFPESMAFQFLKIKTQEMYSELIMEMIDRLFLFIACKIFHFWKAKM